jgi:hypothetical protein
LLMSTAPSNAMPFLINYVQLSTFHLFQFFRWNFSMI